MGLRKTKRALCFEAELVSVGEWCIIGLLWKHAVVTAMPFDISTCVLV